MSFLDRILLGARSLFAALGIPAIFCILCIPSTSWAASFSFVTPIPTPNSPYGIGADATAGTYFHLTGSVSVDGLGFWDSGQDGLSSSYRIGLWDGLGAPFPATPTLLLEGSVPAGSAAPLADGWRFLDLPDLVLGPGFYVLGALKLDPGPTSDPAFVQSVSLGQFPGYIPEIDFAAFAVTLLETGAGFQPPDSYVTAGGLFGPTLFVVPEPGSAFGLVIGLALLARWRPAGPSPI